MNVRSYTPAALWALPLAMPFVLRARWSGPGLRVCVAPPDGWRSGRRLLLLVKDVTLPKGPPVLFRVSVTDSQGHEILLGSFEVIGSASDTPGLAQFSLFRVDVTRALGRWAASHQDAKNLNIRIQPVGVEGEPLEELLWSVRHVAIEAS